MNDTHDRDARLQTLLERRGDDLAHGLIEELVLLHREIDTLKRELAALSGYQAAHDRMLVIAAAAPKLLKLPRMVRIEADQNLRSQDGFYPLEHTSDGTPFRWTGPAHQFSFELFVDRSSVAELTLEAISCIDFDIQKNIALLADGESIPTHVERQDALIRVTAVLPSREGGEVTDLVFVLPATLLPPESDDARSLGLAFQSLNIAARSLQDMGITEEFGRGDSAAAE